MGKLQDLVRVANILKGARDIIARRWVKGCYVSDAAGKSMVDNGRWMYLPDYDEADFGYCGDGALCHAISWT